MSAYPNAKTTFNHTLSRRALSGRVSSCFGELSLHAVLDPVWIPPLDRIDHLSIHQHREMEVVAAGEPRHPAAADGLAFRDGIADLDVERREMAVQRLDAHAVIDDDAVAV